MFDPDTPTKYRHDYINIDGLFDKGYYEKTGYYIYGSNKLEQAGISYPGHFAQIRYRSDAAIPTGSTDRNSFVLYTSPMPDNVGQKFMP